MNSFYTDSELNSIGFAKLGKNIKVSRKTSFYGASRISIGDNSRIDDFCVISAGEGGIEIGKNVHIACFCSIIGKEKITLCDFAGLSSHSAIFSSSDDFSGSAMTNPTIPAKYTNVKSAPVYLGRHVVVGSHTCILPSVSIGEGAAIGASSLVTKNIAEFAIASGVPCKKIKDRNRDFLKLEKEYISE
jgi:galactoside O-acetyltransferase